MNKILWVIVVFIIFIIFITIFVVLNRDAYVDDEDYGVFATNTICDLRIDQCSGNQTFITGEGKIVTTCIPNSTSGKGCLLPNGKQFFGSTSEITKNCRLACPSNSWTYTTGTCNFYIQDGTNTRLVSRCVGTDAIALMPITMTCILTRSEGVEINECTLNGVSYPIGTKITMYEPCSTPTNLSRCGSVPECSMYFTMNFTGNLITEPKDPFNLFANGYTLRNNTCVYINADGYQVNQPLDLTDPQSPFCPTVPEPPKCIMLPSTFDIENNVPIGSATICNKNSACIQFGRKYPIDVLTAPPEIRYLLNKGYNVMRNNGMVICVGTRVSYNSYSSILSNNPNDKPYTFWFCPREFKDSTGYRFMGSIFAYNPEAQQFGWMSSETGNIANFIFKSTNNLYNTLNVDQSSRSIAQVYEFTRLGAPNNIYCEGVQLQLIDGPSIEQITNMENVLP